MKYARVKLDKAVKRWCVRGWVTGRLVDTFKSKKEAIDFACKQSDTLVVEYLACIVSHSSYPLVRS
jgi:hypothetical protein